MEHECPDTDVIEIAWNPSKQLDNHNFRGVHAKFEIRVEIHVRVTVPLSLTNNVRKQWLVSDSSKSLLHTP